MKAKKSTTSKKNKSPKTKVKKAANKKLLHFGTGRVKKSSTVIVPELIDFEIMNFSNSNDTDDHEYDTRDINSLYEDEEDESFDNRSYYRYRNFSNPERP